MCLWTFYQLVSEYGSYSCYWRAFSNSPSPFMGVLCMLSKKKKKNEWHFRCKFSILIKYLYQVQSRIHMWKAEIWGGGGNLLDTEVMLLHLHEPRLALQWFAWFYLDSIDLFWNFWSHILVLASWISWIFHCWSYADRAVICQVVRLAHSSEGLDW